MVNKFTATLRHDFNESIEKKVLVYRVQEPPASISQPLLLGCMGSKAEFAREEWDSFLASVEDSSSFMDKLTEQLASTHMLISSEKCLLQDFQAFIDHQGRLFHIDLDRCFDHINKEGKLFYHPHNLYIQNLLAHLGGCFEEFRLHARVTLDLADKGHITPEGNEDTGLASQVR